MDEDFNRSMASGLAIAGAAVIPIGLILSAVFGGWRGLAGAFVGFGVVSLNTAAAMYSIKWVLKKPVNVIPTILMATMWGRLIILAGVLWGLTYVHSLNSLAMLLCFLALFIAHTVVEIVFGYKGFGLILKSQKDREANT